MNTIEQRRENIQALRRRGIDVPNTVRSTVEQDVPGSEVRSWAWWSAVWSRPQASTWQYNEQELAAAQASWDTSKRHVDNQTQLHAELEERKQQERAQYVQAEDTRKAAELDAVTAELRRSYLVSPGATEEQFQKALPELLEQRARQAALAGTQSQAHAAVRNSIRYV